MYLVAMTQSLTTDLVQECGENRWITREGPDALSRSISALSWLRPCSCVVLSSRRADTRHDSERSNCVVVCG